MPAPPPAALLSPSRRQLLTLLAISALSGTSLGRAPKRIRAIAFDALVLFDPRTIVKRAREVAGEKGDALVAAASTKLFSYTWYYTSAGRYAEFDELAADAFQSAAQSLGLTLGTAEVKQLVDGYSNLDLWPDVPDALQTLRARDVRLAMLSNLSEGALRANLRASRIEEYFDFVLSTDRARQYKPSPKAYELATSAFNSSKSAIGFAASASWDASGATWFGFPTTWVNRNGLAAEPAHAMPRIVSSGMSGVLQLADIGAP
jgi:2-haloacid dehalogenase